MATWSFELHKSARSTYKTILLFGQHGQGAQALSGSATGLCSVDDVDGSTRRESSLLRHLHLLQSIGSAATVSTGKLKMRLGERLQL